MDKKIRMERFRKIRGLILYVLVRSFPAPLDHYEIRCFLDDLRYTISEDELIFHLAYLQEMELIETRESERADFKRQLVKVRPKGINVKDGRIVDVGIDVENIP